MSEPVCLVCYVVYVSFMLVYKALDVCKWLWAVVLSLKVMVNKFKASLKHFVLCLIKHKVLTLVYCCQLLDRGKFTNSKTTCFLELVPFRGIFAKTLRLQNQVVDFLILCFDFATLILLVEIIPAINTHMLVLGALQNWHILFKNLTLRLTTFLFFYACLLAPTLALVWRTRGDNVRVLLGLFTYLILRCNFDCRFAVSRLTCCLRRLSWACRAGLTIWWCWRSRTVWNCPRIIAYHFELLFICCGPAAAFLRF